MSKRQAIQSMRGAIERQLMPRFEHGQLGNGAGVVEVPGKTGYCYVRVRGAVLEALNDTTSYSNNLPVLVGYDKLMPNILQVLGVLRRVGTPTSGGGGYTIVSHHTSHERGGGDELSLDSWQINNLRVQAGTGIAITIYPGVVRLDTGWAKVQSWGDLSLSAYVPAGAVWVVVSLSRADGTVTYTEGTERAALNLLLNPGDIPLTDSDLINLAAVRLYAAQTQIDNTTDIVDLRFSSSSSWGAVKMDTEANIQASDPTRGLLGYATDKDYLYLANGTIWSNVPVKVKAGQKMIFDGD